MIAFVFLFCTVHASGDKYNAYARHQPEQMTQRAEPERTRVSEREREKINETSNLTTSAAESRDVVGLSLFGRRPSVFTRSNVDKNTTRKYTRRVTDSFFILPYVVVLEFV